MIRCKFKCTSKVLKDCGYEVYMAPVTCGSNENEEFFHYTPYGEMRIGTVNEVAASQLEVGKEYFLDITPAN